MKLQLLTFSFCALISGLGAQTKKIAFKSHSGAAENFTAYLSNAFFESESSNFGMAPRKIVKTAKLDSLIFVSDTSIVMVTSNYCTDRYDNDATTLWQAGKDTVINHPLFRRQHSLDSIKKVLKNQYHFRNSIDSVTFIGYDNQSSPASGTKKRNAVPVILPADPKKTGPPGWQLFTAVGFIAFMSVIAGILFRRPTQMQ